MDRIFLQSFKFFSFFRFLKNRFCLAAVFFVFFVFCASPVEYFWVGGASGDWNVAANWNTAANGSGSSGIPAAADTVTFRAAAQVTNLSGADIEILEMNIHNGYGGVETNVVALDLNGAKFTLDKIDCGEDDAYVAGNLKLSNADVVVRYLDTYGNADCKLTLENSDFDVTVMMYVDARAAGVTTYIYGDSASTFKVSGTMNDYGRPNLTLTSISFNNDIIVDLPNEDPVAGGIFGCTWTGAAGTSDWFTPANWSSGSVPTHSNIVKIPGGLAVYPILGADAEATSVDVQAGAQFSTGGYKLVVSTFYNSGNSVVSAGGTLNVLGHLEMLDGSLEIDGTGGSIKNILSSGGNLKINGGTVTSEKLECKTDGTVLVNGGTLSLSEAAVVYSGGNLNVDSGSALLPSLEVQNGGNASVSGGNMNVSGDVRIADSGSSVDVSGGSMNVAGSLAINSRGAFGQTGGTFSVSGDADLAMASFSQGGGTSNFLGDLNLSVAGRFVQNAVGATAKLSGDLNCTGSGAVAATAGTFEFVNASTMNGTNTFATLAVSGATLEVKGTNTASFLEVGASGTLYITENSFSASSVNSAGKIALLTASGSYVEGMTSGSLDFSVVSGESFTFGGSSVVSEVNVKDSIQLIQSGNSSVASLKAENLGGKTVEFLGTFGVNTLSLTGTSEASLLNITGSGKINLASSQTGGNFLSIESVTIGTLDSDPTYTAAHSIPSDNETIPHGWIIDTLYTWIGATDSNWAEGSNWDIGFVPFKNADIKIPAAGNNPSLAAVVVPVVQGDFTIEAGGELHLDGKNLTVNGTWSNSGTVYSYGTETVTFAASSVDGGCWTYFNDAPASTGVIKNIPNLTFKDVAAEGNGRLANFTAEKFSIKPDAVSSGAITLIAASNAVIDCQKIDFDTPAAISSVLNVGAYTLELGTAGGSAEISGSGSLNVSGTGSFVVHATIGKSGSYFGDLNSAVSGTVRFDGEIYASSILCGTGTVTFSEAIDSSSDILIKGISSCKKNVTAVSSILFEKAVDFGASATEIKTTAALSSIEFDSAVTGTGLVFTSPSVILKNNVTMTSDQTYSGNVVISGASASTISSAGGNIVFKKNIALSSGCNVKVPLSGGYSIELNGISDAGTDAFSATGEKITLFGADYVTNGIQTYDGKEVHTKTNVAGTYNWTAGGTGINVNTSLYLDHSSSTFVPGSNITASYLYFLSGNLSVNGVEIHSRNTFAVWGSAFNASDPRFAGANTRFDMAGMPKTAGSTSAKFSVLTNAVFRVDGKFYVNGADLNGTSLSLILPDNADSAVLFNGTASSYRGPISGAGSFTQWGADSKYAAVFNCTVANVTVSCAAAGGSSYVAAASGSLNQNVTDGGNNTTVLIDASGNPNSKVGFQFDFPEITEAYSVFDDVIYVKFSMPVENSNGEISRAVAYAVSKETGGVWCDGGNLSLSGGAFADADCTTPLAASGVTEIYIKAASGLSWNTDATAASSGNSTESTDRKGNSKTATIDLSLLEGVFSAEYGHTMCSNYGTGAQSAYVDTYDKCSPVLVGVYSGQEIHKDNTGAASSQEFYDAHNFLEFRYSEPVDIDSLLHDGTDQNVQATAALGEITNNASGFTVAGLAGIGSGSVNSGSKSAGSPHALYRKFSTVVGGTDSSQAYRIRLSVAGFVDGSITYDGSTFHNWPGYINRSVQPDGAITRIANDLITDLATDSFGNPVNNKLSVFSSAVHTLPALTVNTTESGLYGKWDCRNPVFAVYVTDLGTSETGWDWKSSVSSSSRQYEIVGTADSNAGSWLDRMELHLFDNEPDYNSSDSYKWASMNGWANGGAVMSGFDAPETSGGARPFAAGAERTYGGIRRSSLENAVQAFSYTYTIDSSTSSSRSFDGNEISQDAKSPLYRTAGKSQNNTKKDGLYLKLKLNSSDIGMLPIRTTFSVVYDPSLAYITDLAGNRLVQTDSGSSVKRIHSIDITPPSFLLSLSPIGEDKLYMVFTKTLAYNGTVLNNLSSADLAAVMAKIKANLEFVLSSSDDKDAATVCADLFVKSVSLASTDSIKYTALLLTLNRRMTLTDIENTWIRISNTSGVESVTTIFGTELASPIQDKFKNCISLHTCHAVSDFAVNAVNVLYAHADSTDDDGWNEQGIYGTKHSVSTDNYAVHDFSENPGKSGTLKTGDDIVFQVQFVGGHNGSGYFAPENSETFVVIPDCKDNLSPSWISDKFNRYTDGNWRVWLTAPLDSLASSYNSNRLNIISEIENVSGSDLLKNFRLKKSVFEFGNKKEYQFIFGIKPDAANSAGFVLDSNGYITINHDGDATTPRIPLYALWMPESNIKNGDFSFVDLWSFLTRDIVKQRGGVTILNNVINANVKEQTVIQVETSKAGNLNVYVMTLDGNIVKRLSKGRTPAGTHYFRWDGTNGNGKAVARGMYFVRVTGPEIDETRKVMVVKN